MMTYQYKTLLKKSRKKKNIEKFCKKRYEKLQTKKTIRFAEVKKLKGFTEKLRAKQSIPLEFDEDLWGTIIDYATVWADGTLTFALKDGKEIEERI